MAGNRTIIGSESDDTRKIDLDKSNNKVTLPVSIYDSSGNQVSLASGWVPNTFDSISIMYSGGNISTVFYKKVGVIVATLTLGYDGSNNLISITKS